MSTKILDFAPSAAIAIYSTAKNIEGIQLGKPGGKRSIALKLLKPGDVNSFWEPYLLAIQTYLLSTMPELSSDGWMSMQGNEEKFSQASKVVSALLIWQLLYKELEAPKFKIQCNQKPMIESLRPSVTVLASLSQLCKQVYPGDYAEFYRDYLHWVAHCWHEEFTQSRSLASSHPGKRFDVEEMRVVNKNYRKANVWRKVDPKIRDRYNPHNQENEPHHYRLIDTSLQQTKDSYSWKAFKDYQKSLITLTTALDQQPHVLSLEKDGFNVIQDQGRPKR